MYLINKKKTQNTKNRRKWMVLQINVSNKILQADENRLSE